MIILVQYFEYIFDDSIIQLFVDDTNIYRKQCLHSQKSKNHSYKEKWRSAYKEEIRMYLYHAGHNK